jgi:hypothetical protein
MPVPARSTTNTMHIDLVLFIYLLLSIYCLYRLKMVAYRVQGTHLLRSNPMPIKKWRRVYYWPEGILGSELGGI